MTSDVYICLHFLLRKQSVELVVADKLSRQRICTKLGVEFNLADVYCESFVDRHTDIP